MSIDHGNTNFFFIYKLPSRLSLSVIQSVHQFEISTFWWNVDSKLSIDTCSFSKGSIIILFRRRRFIFIKT
jgi:hypothetical protein